MQQVSFVFQLSLYALIVLSSYMLGMAEGAPFPHILTPPLAILAFYLTEQRRLFQIRPLTAFVLGVGAFLAAASELLSDDIEARLLSGSHLLAYLSWIVLFQAKELRTYWWMLALCVLQVAVGSVLTNAGSYGMLLVLFLILAFWTMSLFSLHLAGIRLGISATPALAAAGAASGSSGRKSRPLRMGELLRRPSTARSSLLHHSSEALINARFVSGILLAALASLATGMVFFLLVPRLWIGELTFAPDRPEQMRPLLTGFSNEVRLGEIGDILESTEPVMYVETFNERTGDRVDIEKLATQLGYDEPMFRGMVLETYENGRWKANFGEDASGRGRFRQVGNNPPPGAVRQVYNLNPTGSSILFAIPPVSGVRIAGSDSYCYRHSRTGVLLRPQDASSKRPVSYIVYSPLPSSLPNSERTQPVVGHMNPRNVVVEVPQGLDRLVALARQVAGYNPNGQSPPPAEMAQRLVTYLRDNPEFSYSLSASITDPNIDPIEDFLFNRKAGHCEYYASALALMLRSVEIPSRLVNGFKGGDQNGPDEPFEVQERHAHAWVEAFIDGRWLVFDPTPASREESVESLAPPVSTWRDIFDRIQGIWSTLVNMNLQQQQDLLYEPLGDAAAATWQSARTGKRGIAHMFARLTAFLGSPARWGTWQGGLAGLALVVVVAGAVWLAVRYRRIWAVLWAKLMSRPTSSASIVEFYERFRKLCKTRGLVRRPGETQQEFADVVGRSLGGILQPAGLGGFPADLSRAFYQVRFGSRDLSPDELAHIQNQLDSLEAALANGNGRRRPSQPTFSVRPAG